MKPLRSVMPWVWTALIGTAGIAVLMTGYIPAGRPDILAVVMAVVVLILITALGSVISARQPGNRIAWLLHAISLGLLLSMWSSPIAEGEKPISPDFWDYTAIVIINGISLSFLYPVFLLLFLFPTGRFLTRRWAWAGWIGVLFTPAVLLVALFSNEVGPLYADENWRISNPFGFLPSEMIEFMSAAWAAVLMALAVGGVVAMIIRYRRSDSVVRAQIKWVLYAAVVAAVILPFAFGDSALLSGLLFLTVIGIIPVAITIAITRYKLFEIDRIISRTLGYILVVGVLGIVYVVGAVWLPTQLFEEQPPIFVAGSTLAVAALFNPVRKRIVGWVDRRFYRSRYDAEQVVEQFADRLRDELDVDQLTQAWVVTVTETMQPSAIGVWVQDQRADNKH